MQKMWSLQHPASSLDINPFWVILSNKDHILHRAWPSCLWLWHSKLADQEFQAALRRPKCLAVKTHYSNSPYFSLRGIAWVSFPSHSMYCHYSPMCMISWGWKDSKFPSFCSYNISVCLSPLGWTRWAKYTNRGFCKSTSYNFLGK